MMVWAKDRDGRTGSTSGCSRIGSTSGRSRTDDTFPAAAASEITSPATLLIPAVSSWDGRKTRIMNVSHMTPWVCSEITTPHEFRRRY